MSEPWIWRGHPVLALILGVLLAPGLAQGGATTRYSLLAGGEVWLHPEAGGHGLLMVAAARSGLARGGRLGLEYNTDTARLWVTGFRFRDGRLELGGTLQAQAGYAGLLPDYYRRGRLDERRGFWASYAAALAGAKLNLPGNHHPEVTAGLRRWWFDRRDATADALVLPAETAVVEVRLRHTWWKLNDDAAWRDRHRTFPRQRGLAIGLEAGLDRRGEVRAWGARDEAAFDPADQRNDPEGTIVTLRQWLRAGRRLAPGWRVQVLQQAAWGWGEDDLTRLRIGGMNPYVVPVAGAPWAAWLSGRAAAAAFSLHRLLAGEVEGGVTVEGTWVEDGARTGRSAAGRLMGYSAFLDGRWGPAQVDARLGWCPDVPAGDRGQISAYLAAGYGWE